jgi:DNA primase
VLSAGIFIKSFDFRRRFIINEKEMMRYYSDDIIDEVKSSVNIVHYISQFVNLKKAGANYKAPCPFHAEKTPSFVVSPQKQIYHCFGCGAGGNLFTFIKNYEKLTFTESLKKAADFSGVSLPKLKEADPEQDHFFNQLYKINEEACSLFEDNLQEKSSEKMMQYLLDRKISVDTIKKFRLGYAKDSFNALLDPFKSRSLDLEEARKLGLLASKENSGRYYDKFRHRIMFPFFNLSSKIIGFGGRQLEAEQLPKYLNSPESPVYKKGQILYGLNFAIQAVREKEFIILVEGYFDLLRLYDSGIKNAAASSGTALTDEQAKLIRRYTRKVLIAYDGDYAGQKAAIRNANILEKAGLNAYIIPFPDGKDPDDFVLENGVEAFEALLKKQITPIDFQISQFLNSAPNATLEDKNTFITEILDNLAESNNPLKNGLYLHQISEKLQINESLLVDQLNRIVRSKRKYRKKIAERKAEQKEEAALTNEQRQEPSIYKTGVYKAEIGIISLLLDGEQELQKYIFSKLEENYFEDKQLLELYHILIEEFEETGKLSSELIISHFQENEGIIKLIAELSLTEKINPQRFADDCLFQLKKWQLQKTAETYKKLIKEETANSDSLGHYNTALFNILKELNQLEKGYKKKQLL